MNKNQRNSIILVVVIIVVFVVAYIGYGILSKNSPDTSYTPTIASTQDMNLIEKDEKVDAITDESDSNNIDLEEQSDVVSDKSVEVEAEEVNEVNKTPDPEVSNIMPDLPLVLLNGEETTFWQLAEFGKPVVINSFASWCPPCKQEMPHFIKLSEKYKDEVTFIFFDSFDGERETEETLNAFADEYFIEDTICVIDRGYISYLFKSNSLPTTILLNKKGEPINGYQGMVSEEILEKAIIQLINE